MSITILFHPKHFGNHLLISDASWISLIVHHLISYKYFDQISLSHLKHNWEMVIHPLHLKFGCFSLKAQKTIKILRVWWFFHMTRMPQQRLVRQVLMSLLTWNESSPEVNQGPGGLHIWLGLVRSHCSYQEFLKTVMYFKTFCGYCPHNPLENISRSIHE